LYEQQEMRVVVIKGVCSLCFQAPKKGHMDTISSTSRIGASQKTFQGSGSEEAAALKDEDEAHVSSSSAAVRCSAEDVWRELLPPSRACHWSMHVVGSFNSRSSV
jgi:hypothetical protein